MLRDCAAACPCICLVISLTGFAHPIPHVGARFLYLPCERVPQTKLVWGDDENLPLCPPLCSGNLGGQVSLLHRFCFSANMNFSRPSLDLKNYFWLHIHYIRYYQYFPLFFLHPHAHSHPPAVLCVLSDYLLPHTKGLDFTAPLTRSMQLLVAQCMVIFWGCGVLASFKGC